MTTPLLLIIAMVVLFASGFYLLMDRSLTRVLLGFLLAGNGANLLIFLMSSRFGAAPLVTEDGETITDPLPQAFILTAIVITFGVSAFMLALIYRSWRLAREDEDAVQDDTEDTERAKSHDTIIPEEVTDVDVADTREFDLDELDGTGAGRGER